MALEIDSNTLPKDPEVIRLGGQRLAGIADDGDPIYQGDNWQEWIYSQGMTLAELDWFITRYNSFAGNGKFLKTDGTVSAGTAKMHHPLSSSPQGYVSTHASTGASDSTTVLGAVTIRFTQLSFT